MGDQGRGTRPAPAHSTSWYTARSAGARFRTPWSTSGNGRGVAYVTEDPRLYHLVIESGGVDWSIAVEEAVVGDVQQPR